MYGEVPPLTVAVSVTGSPLSDVLGFEVRLTEGSGLSVTLFVVVADFPPRLSVTVTSYGSVVVLVTFGSITEQVGNVVVPHVLAIPPQK